MATKSSSASDRPVTAHREQSPINHSSNNYQAASRPPIKDLHLHPHPDSEQNDVPFDHKIPPEEVVHSHPDFLWSRIRYFMREPLSEFLGTFILVLFGDGSIAQVVLSDGTRGDYQSICWGFGLGIMLGVYASGISGGHINPAVTLANCLLRRFPWRKLPIYWLAQLLGAMTAAAVVYGNYRSAIDDYEGSGIRTVPGGDSESPTAGIFATYPAPFMTRTGMFFSELLGSALLMFMIYALKDDGNIGMGNHLTPLGLFFVLFGIAACFGWETGFAVNPARDFGPRLVTAMIGYGGEVWSAGGYYFWIPIIAPLCGCTLGGWMYDMFLFAGNESTINTEGAGFKRLLPSGSEKRHHALDATVQDQEDSV